MRITVTIMAIGLLSFHVRPVEMFIHRSLSGDPLGACQGVHYLQEAVTSSHSNNVHFINVNW